MRRKRIKVGMADLNIAKPPNLLTTLGLGSCIGIVLYDERNKIGGLAHGMLPNSREIRDNSNVAKFVDSGIDELIRLMEEKGANPRRLIAKIAGGSQMFNFQSDNDVLRIGERNVEAAKEKLNDLGIEIVAEDTGGNFGRTITFNPENGSLHIRTIGHGEKTI